MLKINIIGCFIIFCFASCRELVQDDFPDISPTPVVYSILEEGEPVRVHLSWTAKLDTSRLKTIDNANVELYVNGQYAETLSYGGTGMYTAATVAGSNARYTCVVAVPGKEIVTASDSLPTVVAPSDVVFIPIAGRDEEGYAYPAIRFTFANNPNERQYYEAVIWEMREDGSMEIDPETGEWIWQHKSDKSVVQPAPVTDPILQSEGLSINVFSNEQISGNSYTMTINYRSYDYENMDGDNWQSHVQPTVLELRAVSYDYYRYARQKYLYEVGFEPEFGKSAPAFSLYSNINNGYGIFAGYASAVSDTLNQKTRKSW